MKKSREIQKCRWHLFLGNLIFAPPFCYINGHTMAFWRGRLYLLRTNEGFLMKGGEIENAFDKQCNNCRNKGLLIGGKLWCKSEGWLRVGELKKLNHCAAQHTKYL